jgi:hypothetical protein
VVSTPFLATSFLASPDRGTISAWIQQHPSGGMQSALAYSMNSNETSLKRYRHVAMGTAN